MNIELSEKEIQFLVRALVCSYAETENDFENPSDIGSTGMVNKLIGKLIIRGLNCDYDFHNEARKERYLETPINKYLFMGAGFHSTIVLNKIMKRIAFAAAEQSGRQQNGGQGTEYDNQMEKECKQSIVNVVLDVMAAFDIKKEDLP